MKLQPLALEQQLPALLKEKRIRTFLFCGVDDGRIAACVRAVQDAARKAFGDVDSHSHSAAQVTKGELRLADAINSTSLFGGGALYHIEGVTDGFLKQLEALPENNSDTIIILQAGSLPTRAKLFQYFDQRADCVIVPCYEPDARAQEQSVRHLLSAHGLSAGAEQVQMLVEVLGADYMLMQQEIAKLALYVGEQTQLSEADIQASISGYSDDATDQLFFALLARDAVAFTHTLSALEQQRIATVAITRGLLYQCQRMVMLLQAIKNGSGLEQALGASRPPVFFKHKPLYMRNLPKWNLRQAKQLSAQCLLLERDAKLNPHQDYALLLNGFVPLMGITHRRVA